jgi:hypothetical protein
MTSSLLTSTPPGKKDFQHENRFLGHADVDLVDVTAEDGLAQAFEQVGDAQRGHQQRRAFLVDQMPQHQPLDQPGHQEHDGASHQERQRGGDHGVAGAGPFRHPLGEAGHGERGKEHHGALCKVEHAGGFEDQHEAKRHQRIEHAGHQATKQGFQKECHLMLLP